MSGRPPGRPGQHDLSLFQYLAVIPGEHGTGRHHETALDFRLRRPRPDPDAFRPPAEQQLV